MRTIKLELVAKSRSTNSFGLRGLILANPWSGRAFQVGANYLSVEWLERHGGRVSLPIDRRGNIGNAYGFTFEIPSKLQRLPLKARREFRKGLATAFN